jgi:hypothetical protein
LNLNRTQTFFNSQSFTFTSLFFLSSHIVISFDSTGLLTSGLGFVPRWISIHLPRSTPVSVRSRWPFFFWPGAVLQHRSSPHLPVSRNEPSFEVDSTLHLYKPRHTRTACCLWCQIKLESGEGEEFLRFCVHSSVSKDAQYGFRAMFLANLAHR